MHSPDPRPKGILGLAPAPAGTDHTGRHLLLFGEKDGARCLKFLEQTAGVRAVARSADFTAEAVEPDKLGTAEALFFDRIGAAVVNVAPPQLEKLRAALGGPGQLLAIEPERILRALEWTAPGAAATPAAAGYVQGFRDGVNALTGRLLEAGVGVPPAAPPDESQFTWGLQACRVSTSAHGGRGVRVAVLDTGLDLEHPDFAGRQIVARSFVPGETAQDGNGHGTHTTGTACGAQNPGTLPRYGIAWQAEIHAGKVLSDEGSGGDSSILAGINWAIASRCQLISMSLGAPVQPGQSFSQIYEQVARRALDAGTLIIAAAGNESRRPVFIAPVAHPANCPSILAVAAVDAMMGVAPFSCGGLNPDGGQVDIAGPGVDVHSSVPRPRLHARFSGTSMATPHVAGCAALHVEAAQVVGPALWQRLTAGARRLEAPSRDVGAGLVQAPSAAC